MMILPTDPIRWFSETLRLTGVAHTTPERNGNPDFIGKRIGLLNGSSWITPWGSYFGRLFVPGAHLVNIGNEAVQINFMEEHQAGKPVPPTSNIEAFVRYAQDLAELGHVDVILITCSTMNRSFPAVVAAMKNYGIPVVQIDQPMMEQAVNLGGETLVIATHGPTVASTQALLDETAVAMNKTIRYCGATVETAWYCLAAGDVQGHNNILAQTIREQLKQGPIDSVVLAQLSMSVFLLSYPDPLSTFGVPVLSSGQCGFERVAEMLRGQS